MNKLEENPLLGQISESHNQIKFRMPQIMNCNKSNLEILYYGLYTKANMPTFIEEYELLKEYSHKQEICKLLKLTEKDLFTENGALKLCTSFAWDNTNEYYLKNGLAFIKKEGVFCLGCNDGTIQWKDSLISYTSDGNNPLVAYLLYNKENQLQTQDGYIVDKLDPKINELRTNQIYAFSYEAIYLNEPYAILTELKYKGSLSRIMWSTMTNLIFKIIMKNNLLPYNALMKEILRQEEKY